MKLAVITDPHYSDTATPGGGQSMDLPFKRVLSSASARVREFFAVTKRYNPDKYLFLGDLLDIGYTDEAAVAAIHKADVVASGVNYGDSGDILYICGDVDVAFLAPQGFYREASIITLQPSLTSGNWWYGSGELQRCAWFTDAGGFRIVGLAFTSATAFDDSKWGSALGDNQLDWLGEAGGPLDTVNPVIMLSHSHLTTALSGIYPNAYMNNATLVAAIQTLLEAQGNVKAVLTGHYHKGTKVVQGSMVDIVNGIPYYGLRGSVLGRHTEDYTSNAFYLFDIDATKGVQRITQFVRDQFGRIRTSIGTFSSDKQFGRDRYSF